MPHSHTLPRSRGILSYRVWRHPEGLQYPTSRFNSSKPKPKYTKPIGTQSLNHHPGVLEKKEEEEEEEEEETQL
ncbi:hypothetical protein BHYA_0031g00250 [Botrytis hyacinthi]|uniref:Uncharacterized protein n=1 Tax=Botrytis hyacinthi TaxID=278943 RepID=A0A4Z1H6F7_9HELO|nr:hypothetical protein BHYA_0031g00250 [Botrytis hyacinthi]